MLHEMARTDGARARRFWTDEYRLVAQIARFPKPVVTTMSGIVMGGGVGLGAHARHRIVTESTQLAMPEVGIGLMPDAGGTWLFSRAPGELGTYLALTGEASVPAMQSRSDSPTISSRNPRLGRSLRR